MYFVTTCLMSLFIFSLHKSDKTGLTAVECLHSSFLLQKEYKNVYLINVYSYIRKHFINDGLMPTAIAGN